MVQKCKRQYVMRSRRVPPVPPLPRESGDVRVVFGATPPPIDARCAPMRQLEAPNRPWRPLERGSWGCGGWIDSATGAPGGASRGPREARGARARGCPHRRDIPCAFSSPSSAPCSLEPLERTLSTMQHPRQPRGASGGAWGSWGALGFRGCIGGQQHPQQQHNRGQQHPSSKGLHSGPSYHRGAVAPASRTARNARARTAPMASRVLTAHPRGSPRTDPAQGRQGWPAWAPRMHCRQCRSPRLP